MNGKAMVIVIYTDKFLIASQRFPPGPTGGQNAETPHVQWFSPF